jgi:hypothetical protein
MFVEEMKNTKEWENFLEVTPEGTFYHSIKWKHVMDRSFPYLTTYFVVRSENERLIGIFPASILTLNHMKVLSSLPHSDFGGPIIERSHIQEGSLCLRKFLSEFSQEKGISYAKICFLKDGSESFFKSPRCHVNDSKGVVNLDIGKNPSAFIWKSIFRNRYRRNINLFKKKGFQVREASSRSDLKLFLNLYSKNMKHIGAQAYPARFFDNMWNLLYPENFNILFVEERETLGCGAFFKYGQTVYLTYFGLDRELASSLPSAMNVFTFLCWNQIKWAEQHDCKYVCFGSTPAHPKGENERVNLSQKVIFGGSLLQQEIVLVPFNSYASAILLFGSKIISVGKAMRSMFPRRLQRTVERRLGRLF